MTTESEFWSSQRKHLGLSYISAPGPEKQQNQTSYAASGPVAMTHEPCPGADQSVKAETLKGHAWKADEYSFKTLP